MKQEMKQERVRRIRRGLASGPVLALSLILAMAPASLGAPAAGQPQFPAPGARTKIIFGQPTAPPNVVHAPVELAKAFGLLDKFNIDLEVKDFEGSTRALTAALTGAVNVGTLDCQNAYGNGVPFVGFYGPAPKLPQLLVARDNVRTLRDLKGKKLGLSSAPGGFVDRMNRAVLDAAGLQIGDVTQVQTTTAGRVAALVTGQTDTAIFHYEQAANVLRTQKDFHVLYDVGRALPNYQYHVYCANKQFVAAHREAIVNLVAATILAVRYAFAHRTEAIQTIQKITGANPQDIGYAYAKIVTGCVWARNLGLDISRLNWTINYEHQAGNLRNVYDARQMLDMSIANEALQKAGGAVPVPEGCE